MKDEVAAAINHFSVRMENQNGKLDAVLEAVGDMQQKVAMLPTMQQDITELAQEVRALYAKSGNQDAPIYLMQ